MQNITSVNELKYAIQLLEAEHTVKEQLLKEQFHITYEGLKPVNLIKSIFKNNGSSSSLIDDLISSSMGMASGYLTKKIIVGGSGNIFRKIIGSLIQFGVTKLVANNPDTIKSLGQFIFQQFFIKRNKL